MSSPISSGRPSSPCSIATSRGLIPRAMPTNLCYYDTTIGDCSVERGGSDRLKGEKEGNIATRLVSFKGTDRRTGSFGYRGVLAGSTPVRVAAKGGAS
jgi:hypothetical protein